MSIASEITRLQGAKSDIRSSIESKGVNVPSEATLDAYSQYIDNIVRTQADWNENDNVAESYVRNRTHYDDRDTLNVNLKQVMYGEMSDFSEYVTSGEFFPLTLGDVYDITYVDSNNQSSTYQNVEVKSLTVYNLNNENTNTFLYFGNAADYFLRTTEGASISETDRLSLVENEIPFAFMQNVDNAEDCWNFYIEGSGTVFNGEQLTVTKVDNQTKTYTMTLDTSSEGIEFENVSIYYFQMRASRAMEFFNPVQGESYSAEITLPGGNPTEYSGNWATDQSGNSIGVSFNDPGNSGFDITEDDEHSHLMFYSDSSCTISTSGGSVHRLDDKYIPDTVVKKDWNISVNSITSNSIILDVFKNGIPFNGTLYTYFSYGSESSMTRSSSAYALTVTSGSTSITSSNLSIIASVLGMDKVTRFYFEFKETASSDNFYTLNYTRSHDRWKCDVRTILSNLVLLSCYKNGVGYTGELRVSLSLYEPGSHNSTAGVNLGNVSFSSGSAQLNLTTTQLDWLNSPRIGYINFNFMQPGNDAVLDTVTYSRKAGSIVSGENGFTTGDQVYSLATFPFTSINSTMTLADDIDVGRMKAFFVNSSSTFDITMPGDSSRQYMVFASNVIVSALVSAGKNPQYNLVNGGATLSLTWTSSAEPYLLIFVLRLS